MGFLCLFVFLGSVELCETCETNFPLHICVIIFFIFLNNGEVLIWQFISWDIFPGFNGGKPYKGVILNRICVENSLA